MVAEVTALLGRGGRVDEGVGVGSMVVGEAVKTGGGGCCMVATPVRAAPNCDQTTGTGISRHNVDMCSRNRLWILMNVE